ncbi:hypothetical protein [Niveispirillum sp. KHB5.9]|uniref:phage tail tip fiber protein n=1 Tax=Niveispirillum sp. KHB5.9 TaxID=3400269 RepID=UPI003A87C634
MGFLKKILGPSVKTKKRFDADTTQKAIGVPLPVVYGRAKAKGNIVSKLFSGNQKEMAATVALCWGPVDIEVASVRVQGKYPQRINGATGPRTDPKLKSDDFLENVHVWTFKGALHQNLGPVVSAITSLTGIASPTGGNMNRTAGLAIRAKFSSNVSDIGDIEAWVKRGMLFEAGGDAAQYDWRIPAGGLAPRRSSNPVAAALDYLLNVDYGLGIDPATLDLESWIQGMNVCDEQVGNEPRFSINGIFGGDDDETHADVIERILEAANAQPFQYGNRIRLFLPRPRSVVAWLDRSNFIPSGAETADVMEVPNAIHLEYTDPTDLERRTVRWEDPVRIARFGEILDEVRRPDIQSRTQASRMASYLGRSRLGEDLRIEGVADQRFMNLEPGNLVAVTAGDGEHTWFTEKKFWITSINPDTEDGDVGLELVEYAGDSIYDDSTADILDTNDPVRTYDDSGSLPNPLRPPLNPVAFSHQIGFFERNDRKVYYVDLFWDEPEQPDLMHSAFVIYRRQTGEDQWQPAQTVNGAARTFRDTTADLHLVGCEYLVISRTSAGIEAEKPTAPHITVPRAVIPGPSNFVFQTNASLDPIGESVALIVSWNNDGHGPGVEYEVSYTIDGEGSYSAGRSAEMRITVSPAVAGRYVFRVIAYQGGLQSDPVTAAYTLDPRSLVETASISHLELVGGASGVEFTGRDAVFTWRGNFPSTSFEIGNEPYGAGSGWKDPAFKRYVVRVHDIGNPDRPVLVREDYAEEERFEYTFERNSTDARQSGLSAPRRSFMVTVTIQDKIGRETQPARLSVSNMPPRTPDFTIGATFNSAFGRYEPIAGDDLDFQGVLVWMEGEEFDPQAGTHAPRYNGRDTNFIITGLAADTTYHVYAAAYDDFGQTGLDVRKVGTVKTELIDIAQLQKNILDLSVLDEELVRRIELIDGDASLAGSVSQRLDAAQTQLDDAINSARQIASVDTSAARADLTNLVAVTRTDLENADDGLRAISTDINARLDDPVTGLAKAHLLVAGVNDRLAEEAANLNALIGDVDKALNDALTGLPATRTQFISRFTANETAQSNTATALTTLAARYDDPETGVARAHARVTSLATTMSSADAAAASRIDDINATLNDPATGLAKAHGRVTEMSNVVATLDSVTTTRFSAISATINNPATGLPAAHSRVGSLETAVANEKVATASRFGTIEAGLADPATGLSKAHARITDADTARVNADTALASRASVLESAVNDPVTGLAKANARITDTSNIMVSRTDALAGRASSLETSVNSPATGLSATRTWIGTVESSLSTQVSSVASRTSGLETAVNDPNSGLAKTSARVGTLETSVSAVDKASADRTSALRAELFNAGGTIPSVQARINAVESVSVGADAALASRISVMEGKVNDPATGLTLAHSRITSVNDAMVTRTNAAAGRLDKLESSVNDPVTGLLKTQATISGRLDTVAGSATASASALNTLSTTVGNHTSSISTLAKSKDGLEAQYTVKVDANGHVSGFGLATTLKDDVPSSEFIIHADRFAIIKPGSAGRTVPFAVGEVDGQTRVIINSAVIGDATITAAKIKNLTADKIAAGTIDVQDILIKQGNIQVIDPRTGRKRVWLGHIPGVDYGIQIYDYDEKLIFSSGSGLKASAITGLGALATKDKITTSEVNGLGTLATKSSVSSSDVTGLGSLATKSSVSTSDVTGLGSLATVSQLNANNISTYIAGAAIGDALIGNLSAAKITAGNIIAGDIQVGGIETGGGRLFLHSGTQPRIIVDQPREGREPVRRVELGKIGGTSVDYGLIIRDQDSKTILTANGLGLNVVGTTNIAGKAVSEPDFVVNGDTICPAGRETELAQSGTYNVEGGGGMIVAYVTVDGGSLKDLGLELRLYVSANGGGWVLKQSAQVGVLTKNGDTVFRIPASIATSIIGVNSFSVRLCAQPFAMPGNLQVLASTARNIGIAIIGAKR